MRILRLKWPIEGRRKKREGKVLFWTQYREIWKYQRQGKNSKIYTINMKCFLGRNLKGLNRSDFCPKEMVHNRKRLDLQRYLSQEKIGSTGHVKITLIFLVVSPGFDYQVIFKKLTQQLGNISVIHFLRHQAQNNKLYMYYA